MVCYHPITGYRAPHGKVTLHRASGYVDLPTVTIPCGQCIGCRISRAKDWSVRCYHEHLLSEKSCFLTLTYDDAHLPAGKTLVYKDLQNFWKRMRAYGINLRYYACGEYGEESNRPHYHAIVFGYWPSDAVQLPGRKNFVYYTSDFIRRCWPYGNHIVTCVTYETCQYTAQYILKKQLGKDAADYYKALGIAPERAMMSLKPGIGATWFDKYHDDIYKDDTLIIAGRKLRAPKYYDRLFDIYYGSDAFDRVKLNRKKFAKYLQAKACGTDLRVKEVIAAAKLHRSVTI